MGTAILFLLFIPLLLPPSVDGKNKADNGFPNNSTVNLFPPDDIINWCTRSNLHLAAAKVKQINQNCSTDEKCFASEVVSSCSDLNTEDWLESNVVGVCTLNTIYDRYGFNLTKVKSAISTICGIYQDKGKFKDLNCKETVPEACLELFYKTTPVLINTLQSELYLQKTDIGIANMSRKWCGSYKGNTVNLKSTGKEIAYDCINKGEYNETTNWLTDDVAKCTFHSIVKKGTADHETLIHQACEFFKYYGFNGYCQNFTSNCLLSLFVIPLPPPSVDGISVTDDGSSNNGEFSPAPDITEWCRKTDRRLAPIDIADITNNCASKDENCFPEKVLYWCSERLNSDKKSSLIDKDVGECTLNTIYGFYGDNVEKVEKGISSICELYKSRGYYADLECSESVPKTCHKKFMEISPKIDIGTSEIAKKWCGGRYTGGKLVKGYDGKNIAYNCYQIKGESTEPTTNWLTENVARCTFFSIVKDRNADHKKFNREACEFFMPYGFTGDCQTFASKCYEIKNQPDVRKLCNSRAEQHLQPNDIKSVEELCSEKRTKDKKSVCFGEEVSKLCKMKNKGNSKETIGQCIFHTVYYSNYGEKINAEEDSLNLSIQSACKENFNGTDLKCEEFTSICKEEFKNPTNPTHKPMDISEKVSNWCAVDSILSKDDFVVVGETGEEIVYVCYEKLGNKTSPTVEWLSEDVGQCTFHSIFYSQSPHRIHFVKTSCKFFKTFGFGGDCDDFLQKCSVLLEPIYPTTTSTTQATATTPVSSSAAALQTRPGRVATEWYNRPTPPVEEDVEKAEEDDGGRALRLQKEREEEKNKKEVEGDNTSTIVGVSVGVAVLLLLILIIVVIVVVVRMKKRKKAKEEEDQKKKTLTSKSSVSGKTDGKKPLFKKPQPMKPISDPEVPIAMDPLAIKDFNHEGPLRVDIGLHGKPLKHGTGEEEGWSLHEEIVFNKTLNRVRRMGSDVEIVNSSEIERAEVPEASKTEGKAEKSAEDKSKKNKKKEKSSDDKSARNKKTETPMVQTRKKPSKRPLNGRGVVS